MATVLILHDSQEGHTIKIAQFIAVELKRLHHQTELAPIKTPPPLNHLDAVIIGASIHIGHYAKVVPSYIRAHRSELERLPNAFFSVCLSASKDDEESRATAQGYIDTLCNETGWQPEQRASFAGALPFTRYGFFKKLLMKQITKQDGLTLNTRQDYEYTNWKDVSAFVQSFAARLADQAVVN